MKGLGHLDLVQCMCWQGKCSSSRTLKDHFPSPYSCLCPWNL